jgi:D-alanine-D-alanine ligase-like ATP-grasp enzyme
VEIAKDKSYTSYFLAKHGFRVPVGRTFFSARLLPNLAPAKRRGLEEACAYAKERGYPIIAKPNNLSQGKLVSKVCTENELRSVAAAIFEETEVLLIENVCAGRDYRIVVLGEDVVSAYERIPLTVVGDGVSSIEQLVLQKRDRLPALGRPNAEIQPEDPRIWATVRRLGYDRTSILPKGKSLTLLDNANLSTGGEAIDITGTLHPSYRQLALEVSRVMGLRLSGVDIMCPDAERPVGEYTVIEVNGAPGLDNYAALGAEQDERVKDLYREVLKYLEVNA